MPAAEPEFDSGVSLYERIREYLGWYPIADVDVLVLGGGIQGLCLLDELTDQGYAAALVSNAPLGGGQSFDWPGTLAKGYLDPDPERRQIVEERWLSFAHDNQIPVEGGEWYVCSSDYPYQHLTPQWDDHGYGYEERGREGLPEVFERGTVFDKGSGEHVTAIDEYAIDREALVRTLADRHAERIVVGDVTEFTFDESGGAGGSTAGGTTPALDTLFVESHQELTVEFDPAFVVAATGTGTHAFVDALTEAEGFSDAGGDPKPVRDSLSPVTYQNQLVLAVRGPATDLPAVSAYLPHKGMSIVARRHRHREENYVTWYVTNDTAAEDVDPRDATDDATGTLDPETVEVGYNKLFELAPQVKDRAVEGENLEFYAYATLQQQVAGESGLHHARPLDGIANVSVALPSSAAGVWPTTDDTLDIVGDAVEGGGPVDAVPAAGGPPIARLADDRPGARWLDWKGLGVRYPRVQNRPDAVER